MSAVITEPSAIDRVRAWLPRGDTLDDKGFRERHRTLSILLAAHVPVLAVFGIVMGYGALHSVGEAGIAGLFVAMAAIPKMNRRMRGILVSAGLVWCSAVAVHFSGGMIEAHFHFFVILGFIALYQDWAAFGWAIMFTALSHGLGSQLVPDLMFDHEAAIQRPWTWALIHAGMVLFAAVGQIIGWRHAESSQDRATELNTQLVREQAERQASYSRIYVNLARRTQSLLHRQLAVIDQLEESEENPETLEKLFVLDHLTTRVRRSAESLLVMAGEDSPRRWNAPVALTDIARAAASEIEQYERADIRIADPIEVAGTAVVDVTHLLAELIENAAEYSSPATAVIVGGYATETGAVLTIEDHGIGMSQNDMEAANQTLIDPPELDDEVVRHLGFQVVARLARKLGMRVHLRPTAGGGTTAVVELPPALIAQPEQAEQNAPQQPAPSADDGGALAAEAALAQAAMQVDQQQPVAQPPRDAALPTATAAPAQAAPPAPPAAQPMAPAPQAPQPPVQQPIQPPSHYQPVAQAPVEQPAPEPSSQTASGLPMLFMAKKPLSSEPAVTGGHSPVPSEPTPAAGSNGHTSAPPSNGHAPVPPSSPAKDLDIDPLFDELFDASSESAPPAAPVHRSAQPPGTTAATAGAPAASNSSGGLPQRTPAASLAAGLREVLADTKPEDPPPPPEARQALSAFQSAGRAGREAAGLIDPKEHDR